MEKIAGLDDLIKRALIEDIGTGDITTLACVPRAVTAKASLIAKESGVVCGVDVFERVFELYDDSVTVSKLLRDGSVTVEGDVIARLWGTARSILTCERVALNLLQRLSAIATRTREFVNAVSGYKTKITDTRKTTPGLRLLEKYAVRVGGGFNHRYSLQDGVLIKDNHIKAAGGIKEAVAAARAFAPLTLRIEVECETLDQVRTAAEEKVDIIMLDNMPPELIRDAVLLSGGAAKIEASGNMDKRDLAAIAALGVDYISIGALTHSVNALDISLKFE